MPLTFPDIPALLAHGHDDVIDVRSPAEFAEDHIPGAMNLPVLDNEERARVGTIYKQESAFQGRKTGAALVFANAARHIGGPLAGREGGWRPLVYCWRGGQRSGSFAWMLSEIGWRAETLKGGYQSWRRMVNAMLHDTPLPHRVILLDGNTGTAKTDILHRIQNQGGQIIDLEGLARHRGSLLGGGSAPQPSQKGFETQLAVALAKLDPAKPTWVEAESNRIGTILVPPSLWNAMKVAPRVEIDAPMNARVGYLCDTYSDVLEDGPRLRALLDHLRPLRGHEVVDAWHQHSTEGDLPALTQALVSQHYDPAYTRARRLAGHDPIETLDLDGLDPACLDRAAAKLLARQDQIKAPALPETQ